MTADCRMTPTIASAFIAFIAVAWGLNSAVFGVINVDFDDAAAVATQPGFASATVGGSSVTTPFGQGGAVAISFSSDGAVDDRNRGPMHPSQPLGEVGRDFIFGNRGQGATFLDVTVADLVAGQYKFTGYFHDNNGSAPFDIDLDVNEGGGFTSGGTVSRSFGTNPAGGLGTATFDFSSSGVDDVTFRVTASENGHLINGMTLAPQPQPELNVDIGLNGHDVQTGFFSFERPFSAGNDDETSRYLTSLGLGDVVDVTLEDANVFRDRRTSGNPVSGPLGDLAESFFARQNEQTLRLSNLRSAFYDITTYHHDSQVDHEPIGIMLSDAGGSMVDLGVAVDPSTGTDPLEVTSTTTRFRADGMNDVVLTFFELTPAGSIVFNGFELSRAVPEPATGLLSGVSGAALLAWRRRRAKTGV